MLGSARSLPTGGGHGPKGVAVSDYLSTLHVLSYERCMSDALTEYAAIAVSVVEDEGSVTDAGLVVTPKLIAQEWKAAGARWTNAATVSDILAIAPLFTLPLVQVEKGAPQHAVYVACAAEGVTTEVHTLARRFRTARSGKVTNATAMVRDLVASKAADIASSHDGADIVRGDDATALVESVREILADLMAEYRPARNPGGGKTDDDTTDDTTPDTTDADTPDDDTTTDTTDDGRPTMGALLLSASGPLKSFVTRWEAGEEPTANEWLAFRDIVTHADGLYQKTVARSRNVK